MDIFVLDNLHQVIGEINVNKPKFYHELVKLLEEKKNNMPENYDIFIIDKNNKEIMIKNEKEYNLIEDMIFIRETNKDILGKSIFEKNYNKLSESIQDILDDNYNCILCSIIIKNEKPYFCYKCQKIFHEKCLKEWDEKCKVQKKNLECPNCRSELPIENWNKKLDYENIRINNANLINEINEYKMINNMNNNINIIKDKKIKKYEIYIDETFKIFKKILDDINIINSSLKLNNNKYEFFVSYDNLEIDHIANIINNEFELIKNCLKNNKLDKMIDNNQQIKIQSIKNLLTLNKNEVEVLIKLKENLKSKINDKINLETDLKNIYNVIENLTSELKKSQIEIEKLDNINLLKDIIKMNNNINDNKIPIDNENILNKNDNKNLLNQKNNILINEKKNNNINEIIGIVDIKKNENNYICNTKENVAIYINDNEKLKGNKVNKIGCFKFKIIFNNPIINLNSFFEKTNIISLDLSNFDSSKVNDMSNMFRNCIKLKEIKCVNKINTNKVVNMSSMFCSCKKLKYIDLSNYDTSNVSDMSRMFYECIKLKEIKGINIIKTSKVNNMFGMFCNCEEIEYLDLFNFDTSNVTDMSFLFNECFKLKEIKGLNKFNTTKVNNMFGMFYNCKEIEYLDLSNFDTSKVANMGEMFYYCVKLKEIKGINNFNTKKVTKMNGMFSYCKELENLDLSNFDSSKVEDLEFMFSNCSKLKKLNLLNFSINTDNIENAFKNINSNCKLITNNKELLKIFNNK